MELGRLEELDVRTAWGHEAHDFTPWLLEHGDHLAETLGIDVELERSEHPVGGFSLDLIGMDLTNDAVLIVENQLEATDHGHLGQIMTYAAGTDASTVVWIATVFRDEHRQALDWINEQTSHRERSTPAFSLDPVACQALSRSSRRAFTPPTRRGPHPRAWRTPRSRTRRP